MTTCHLFGLGWIFQTDDRFVFHSLPGKCKHEWTQMDTNNLTAILGFTVTRRLFIFDDLVNEPL